MSSPTLHPAPGVARRASGFHRYAWFVVLYNLGVVLWGAFVRATGSGAGCGDHWPLCNGEILPRSPRWETVVELTHRVSSGVDVLLVLALAIAAFRLFPRRHRVRIAAGAALFFLITEALVGAGLVRFGLVVDNASMARAVVMAFHLVNTFFLLAALTLTAVWAGGEAALRLRGQGTAGWLLAAAGAGGVLLGMSGAVTALGDTLYPDHPFVWSDLSTTSHLLIRLRLFHPVIALVVGLVVVAAAWWLAHDRPVPRVRRTAALLGVLYLLQALAGFLNVELAAPVWMQLVHLGLADLVWIALVVLAAAVLATEAASTALEATRPSPAEGRG